MSTRLHQYNRDVLSTLRSISPDHADALNARGIALGWWNDVYYCYNTGKPAEQAAKKIAVKPMD